MPEGGGATCEPQSQLDNMHAIIICMSHHGHAACGMDGRACALAMRDMMCWAVGVGCQQP